MQIGLSHTGGAGAAGGTLLADPPAPPLTAPVRNRYFYGKLLDVHHLELEQSYFLEYRRRLNRLTLGYGVVCGLEVSVAADGKGVIIAPGFAIDGLGREILVTEPICLADPSQLTDDCGRPAGTAEERVVTLCLAYHECPTEPVPVLVSDCDVREGCAAGAIRERYALLVHDGIPASPPYTGIVSVCHELAERVAGLETLTPGSGRRRQPDDRRHPDRLESVPGASHRPSAEHRRLRVSLGAGPGRRPPSARAATRPTRPASCSRSWRRRNRTGTPRPLWISSSTGGRCSRTTSSTKPCSASPQRSSAAAARTGPTQTIEVESGDDQTGDPGGTLAEPVVVRVSAGGSPVAGATVIFTDTSDTPGVFKPKTRKTDANGEASSSWTVGGDGATPWTARASISDSVYADLTANSTKG